MLSLSAWTNWIILLAVALLVGFGLASIFAADPSHGMKQVLFVALGVGVALMLQVVDYQAVGRMAWGVHLIAIALIVYTLVPGAPGVPLVNGARCWIDFKLLRFQPAELAKITYVLTLARYLRFRESQRSYGGLIPPFLLTLFPMVMILKQPDLGMSLVFIPVLFAMLFAAGARAPHLLTIAAAGALCIPLFWFMGNPGTPVFEKLPSIIKPYQRDRVYAMFRDDPRTLQRTGFQQHNALMAFGSGGVMGKGFGDIEVGRRVPENHNDMIYALLGEQFGLWGAWLVLFAYGLLIFAGIETAGSTKDPFGRLAAVGLTAVLAAGAFENLGVVLRVFPVTGVTLPFISYGGSSLLANFTLVGLLMNIASRRPIIMGRSKFEGE
jgi:cell division protein FtsW (lipid II flippase)